MSEVINLYEHIPPTEIQDNRRNYATYPEFKIDVPFRAIVVGGSGSCKSNFVLSMLINKMNCWNKLYFICKRVDEPLYKWYLRKLFVRQCKDQLPDYFYFSNRIEDCPLYTDLNPDERTLIVIDDFASDEKTIQKSVKDLFSHGRKSGASIVWVTQNFYSTSTFIRANVNLVIFKKVRGARNLNMIFREYGPSVGRSDTELRKIYDTIMNGRQQDAMVLDLETTDPSLQVRKNFVGIPSESEK
jgi:hypothetical protein